MTENVKSADGEICRRLDIEYGDCYWDVDESVLPTYGQIYFESHPIRGRVQNIKCCAADSCESQMACSGNPRSPKPIFKDKK